MNNIVASVKNFLKNKNTVTILCVFAGAIVLWIGYNARFNAAVSPVRVPYAVVDIQPRTKIEDTMIGLVEVPSSMLTSSTARSKQEVVDKYVDSDTMIPAGSLFYRSTLVEWSEISDSEWADIDDGNTVVALPVDVTSTLGNSIYPGNYIDLYYVAIESDGRLLLGKLIESIEVLAVKDGNGNNVFEDSSNIGTPAYLLFSVPESYHLLLRKASYLSGEIIPVQRNRSYTEEATMTRIASEYIRDFILSQTVNLDSEELPDISIDEVELTVDE
jgi:Flp pilus assembly protein CpaB